MTIKIFSYLTYFGSPALDLVPKIRIWDDTAEELVVTDQDMVQVEKDEVPGYYKYEFTAYDITKDYICTVDGGEDLAASERFQKNVINATVQKINFIYDVASGRWKFDDVNFQYILYKEDNVTEVARFDMKDIDGNPSIIFPAERVRNDA